MRKEDGEEEEVERKIEKWKNKRRSGSIVITVRILKDVDLDNYSRSYRMGLSIFCENIRQRKWNDCDIAIPITFIIAVFVVEDGGDIAVAFLMFFFFSLAAIGFFLSFFLFFATVRVIPFISLKRIKTCFEPSQP